MIRYRMNSRIKYLLKNTSLFALSEVASKIINFVLVPLYTYVLTKEQYGTADLVFTFASLFSPLIMFNLGEALMRFLLDKETDDSKIRHIEFLTIGFGFIVSLIFIPIIAVLPGVGEYNIFMYLYMTFYAFQQVTVAYIRGKEKLMLYAVCNIINTLLTASLNILFLVELKLGIEGYLMAYTLAYAITGILAFFSGDQLKNYERKPIDKTLAKQMILFSLAVIPNSMMWWIINSSDRLMVSYISGMDENGLLTVAYKIPSLLTTLSFVLMQAWKYSAINEKDSKDKTEFNNKILYLFFRTMLLISAVLLIFNKMIVRIYSTEYFDSWQASSYLMFGNVFLAAATFFGTSYYVEKKMRGNLLSVVIGAVVNIIFNFLLIPYFGATGATMAAAICYVVIMIYRYVDTQKFLKLIFWTPGNLINMVLFLVLLINTNLSYTYEFQISAALLFVLLMINIPYIKMIFSYVSEMFSRLRRK